MENSRKARETAEAALSGPPEQPTKGSAIGMIEAEIRATKEKTARLRALRMERDAVDAAEQAAILKAAPRKAAAAKKAAEKAKATAKAKKSSATKAKAPRAAKAPKVTVEKKTVAV